MTRRRDRRRQETIDDIKDTARSQLADAGPAGISMRAIARHLAITASAVHYYFPSRQALLDALVVDGFTSLADAGVEAARATLGQVRARRASSGSPYVGPTGPGPWITRRSTCCSTATTAPAPSSSETPRSIKPSQVSSASCSRSCGGLSPPVRSIQNASKRPCRHPCAGSSPRGATRTTGAATFPTAPWLRA